MGRRKRGSRPEVLLAHLLKWKYQEGRRIRRWTINIIGQRQKISRCLNESRSLRYKLNESLEGAYSDAIVKHTSAVTYSRTPARERSSKSWIEIFTRSK